MHVAVTSLSYRFKEFKIAYSTYMYVILTDWIDEMFWYKLSTSLVVSVKKRKSFYLTNSVFFRFLYNKTGSYRYILFYSFDTKHRLWLPVNVLSKYIKHIKFFLMKCSVFTDEKRSIYCMGVFSEWEQLRYKGMASKNDITTLDSKTN